MWEWNYFQDYGSVTLSSLSSARELNKITVQVVGNTNPCGHKSVFHLLRFPPSERLKLLCSSFLTWTNCSPTASLPALSGQVPCRNNRGCPEAWKPPTPGRRGCREAGPYCPEAERSHLRPRNLSLSAKRRRRSTGSQDPSDSLLRSFEEMNWVGGSR